MKNEIEQTNVSKVVGVVFEAPKKSHEIEGESFYELVLEVRRLSDTYDYIPVTISERSLKGTEIQKGDEIGVEGEFRSYNKLENEKSKLILHVFAKEVYFGDEIDCLGSNSNEVNLTGFVCKDPVYRVTPFKREICDVLIAVNRRNGKSDYIPCIFWGRNAKYMEAQPVGTKINIEGRIQSRVYTKKHDDGSVEERTAYEISVSRLKNLDEADSSSLKTDAYREYMDFSSREHFQDDKALGK